MFELPFFFCKNRTKAASSLMTLNLYYLVFILSGQYLWNLDQLDIASVKRHWPLDAPCKAGETFRSKGRNHSSFLTVAQRLVLAHVSHGLMSLPSGTRWHPDVDVLLPEDGVTRSSFNPLNFTTDSSVFSLTSLLAWSNWIESREITLEWRY